MQQLRDALPLPCSYRYILFDRDPKFGSEVFEFLQASGIRPIRMTARSPWQNGIAERWSAVLVAKCWITSFRLNEQHLRRLGLEYLGYYHEDRTHIGLEKTTPARRPVEACRTRRATFWPCLESAVFTIGIPGHKRLSSNNTTDEQPGGP